MKEHKLSIVVGVVALLVALPFLVYLLGNLYVFLFDGWQLNSDKMSAAGLGLIVTAGLGVFATITVWTIEDNAL